MKGFQVSVKPLIKLLIFGVFLSTALHLILKSFEDYIKGNTSFFLSQKPITLEDLPSLIACFRWSRDQELSYGEHFFVNVTIAEKDSKNVTLVEGKYVTSLQ